MPVDGDAEVAAARERLAEQLMSDERILGAAPEDATRLLLDRALAALDAAAAATADAAAFAQTGEAIRQAARAIAGAAAEAEDPTEVITAALFPAVAEQTAAVEVADVSTALEEEPPPIPEAPEATAADAVLQDQPPPTAPDVADVVEAGAVLQGEPPSFWERLRGWWR